MRKDRIIRKIKELMTRYFPEMETYLYGSHARGEETPESDVDLLILLPDSYTEETFKKKKYEVMDKVFDLEMEENANLSPLILLKRTWLSRKTPFTINVTRDAILL